MLAMQAPVSFQNVSHRLYAGHKWCQHNSKDALLHGIGATAHNVKWNVHQVVLQDQATSISDHRAIYKIRQTEISEILISNRPLAAASVWATCNLCFGSYCKSLH